MFRYKLNHFPQRNSKAIHHFSYVLSKERTLPLELPLLELPPLDEDEPEDEDEEEDEEEDEDDEDDEDDEELLELPELLLLLPPEELEEEDPPGLPIPKRDSKISIKHDKRGLAVLKKKKF